MTFSLGLALVLLMSSVWLLVCNFRTAGHRHTMINRISAVHRAEIAFGKKYDGWRYVKLEQVDYFWHLFRLFCFRNPWDLYPQELRNLMIKEK